KGHTASISHHLSPLAWPYKILQSDHPTLINRRLGQLIPNNSLANIIMIDRVKDQAQTVAFSILGFHPLY
ncbi:MAG: hypothetical protein DWQ04_00505, partial [Chloroflexi bacterium]